ncbi:phytase [Pedobacter sp.]|uniref:phytase n=1 Tax=Pedobacter sp. TaxID=1411316 RepID=UPI00396CD37D
MIGINKNTLILSVLLLGATACKGNTQKKLVADTIKPVIITEKVKYDTDDPAIWINKEDPSKSLVIGTDKEKNGALYVFDLQGKIKEDLVVRNLQRPNNVDVAYGLVFAGKATDIAITTERMTHNLRIFSLPDMKPVDNGGIPMFEGETGDAYRDLMGIAIYTAPDKKMYAIVGRKNGPTDGSYLWQYLLQDNGKGQVKATLVRKFGNYSGKKEIEAIAVDNENGYIYYSDEQYGVRKYYADPAKGNKELALFGTTGFKGDHEGISIFKTGDKTGYILVSDQQANRFQIFTREGETGNPHQHKLVKIVNVAANQSDGSDVVNIPLNGTFKHGLFVVMSDDKTFHYYRWEDIAGKELK